MIDIRVSLVILTWNRWPIVREAVERNLASAGYPIHELIHVDQGSEPYTLSDLMDGENDDAFGDFCDLFDHYFKPAVQVRHKQNVGVAAGYNRGFAMATGTHIAMTGCDRLMPDGWLKTWVDHIQAIPQTGVISCYSDHEDGCLERRSRGPLTEINGMTIRPAAAMEARICSREFLYGAGFWREDFGLYGFEDAEWSDRADRYAAEKWLINYVIPSLPYARHAVDRGEFGQTIDGLSYQDWKNKTHADPRLRRLFSWCRDNGSPYYNPFARIEPDLLDCMRALLPGDGV